MNERVLQFRIGVVVVASVLLTIILVLYFNGMPRLLGGEYELNILFREAPGVTANTPVRKSGILIGRVRTVELQEDSMVLVRARIANEYPVRNDEVARIISGSLFGDAVVEFVPGGDPSRTKEPIPPQSTITGEVAENPLRVLVNLQQKMNDTLVNVDQVVGSIGRASENVSSLAANVDQFVALNQEQLQRILNQAETALTKFNVAMSRIDEVVGDEELRAKLRDTLHTLPDLLADSQDMVRTLRSVAAGAETNMRNLEGFTGPLGQRGAVMVDNLERSTANLNQLLSELAELSAAINDQQGTLGQLAHNPDLYIKLDRAATNIQEASSRLRPVVNDVRVFADKIARDPSQLGVRGAIAGRQSGIK